MYKYLETIEEPLLCRNLDLGKMLSYHKVFEWQILSARSGFNPFTFNDNLKKVVLVEKKNKTNNPTQNVYLKNEVNRKRKIN